MSDQTTAQGDRSIAISGDAADSTIITGDVHVYRRRPTGAPFHVPAVPRYFVARPEVSDDLKRMLLIDEDAAPGALVVSAVHGLGGIGKTTLVAAMAHDPELQARFLDGVLWATLGQEPDVLSILTGWIQALGDYDFHPTLIENASAHLRTLLHNQACLLVVDDAWSANYARAFLVGGERCRVLVTTRDATLARKVGARLYDLDVMTEAQALALFEARLGPLDGNREEAAALARELGYLPLALELAAAQVEGGLAWAELLVAFRRGLADLAVLDLDEATYRNESLRLSFRLGLEQLSPEDQEAFAWLGVLPEDARLNPAMAATLWDQPEAEARKRLRHLRTKALLKAVDEDRYTVHDLLHDEARLRLVERMSLAEAHVAFLGRYRARCANRWPTLSDDGYIHEHLTWHMEQAEQAEAIHALLRLETKAEQNAWYEAREALGQTAGYLDDARRAWRLAEAESIALHCRYALTTASLNSLAGNIRPALLVALVEQRVWTADQGLAYARQAPDPRQRTEALFRLAPHLPDPLLGEALTVSRDLRDERIRADTLAKMAPHLPEPLLRQALTAAREIKDDVYRALALAELAPRLAELGYPEEVLTLAQELLNQIGGTRILAGLAPYLSEPLLSEALVAARRIADEWRRAVALADLAPYLPEPLVGEALTEARQVKDERRELGRWSGWHLAFLSQRGEMFWQRHWRQRGR